MQIHSLSQPSLIIITKGADIFGHDCMFSGNVSNFSVMLTVRKNYEDFEDLN